METLIGLALFAGLFGALIGALLPRFSLYFLGPVMLIIALMALVALLRTNLHTEGSPAGLVVGGILAIAVGIGGCSGIGLVVAGMLRLRKPPEEVQAPTP